MHPGSRHQCLIYQGPPTQHLKALAETTRSRISHNYRCFYLNSEPMVAGMRSYLAAAGVDVASETAKTSLKLTSERHLNEDGSFDRWKMLASLEDALEQALIDGYDGLFATGDMTWEFGPERDFDELLEYEWHLEDLFRRHPQLSGICQYHADSLPLHILRIGVLTHPSIFVNETLSMINPQFLHWKTVTTEAMLCQEVDLVLARLCQQPH